MTPSLRYLDSFFKRPQDSWPVVQRETGTGLVELFFRYHLPLYSVIFPLIFLGALLREHSWRRVLYKGLALPLAVFTAYTVGLWLAATFLEESASRAGGKYLPGSGLQVLFMSGMVFVSLSLFFSLPVLGILFLAIGFLYQNYLIYLSAGPVFSLPPRKRARWYLGFLLACGLLLLLAALALALLLSLGR